MCTCVITEVCPFIIEGYVLQEYRARKQQKLQKKLAEQLRAHNKGSGRASAGIGLGSDLSQVLASFLDHSGSQHSKGSRFQHAERLQFAKVRIDNNNNNSSSHNNCYTCMFMYLFQHA